MYSVRAVASASCVYVCGFFSIQMLSKFHSPCTVLFTSAVLVSVNCTHAAVPISNSVQSLKGHSVILEFYIYDINEVIIRTHIFIFSMNELKAVLRGK